MWLEWAHSLNLRPDAVPAFSQGFNAFCVFSLSHSNTYVVHSQRALTTHWISYTQSSHWQWVQKQCACVLTLFGSWRASWTLRISNKLDAWVCLLFVLPTNPNPNSDVRAFKTSAVSLRTDKRIRFPRTDLNENVSVEDIKQFRRVEKKFGTVTGELEESKAFDEIPRYFPKGVPTVWYINTSSAEEIFDTDFCQITIFSSSVYDVLKGEDDVPDWFGEPQQERPYDPLDFDRDEDFAKVSSHFLIDHQSLLPLTC